MLRFRVGSLLIPLPLRADPRDAEAMGHVMEMTEASPSFR